MRQRHKIITLKSVTVIPKKITKGVPFIFKTFLNKTQNMQKKKKKPTPIGSTKS